MSSFEKTYAATVANTTPNNTYWNQAMCDLKITKVRFNLASVAMNNISNGIRMFLKKYDGSGNIDDASNWDSVGTGWTIASSNQSTYSSHYHAPSDWEVSAGDLYCLTITKVLGDTGATTAWFSGGITIEEDWNNQVTS